MASSYEDYFSDEYLERSLNQTESDNDSNDEYPNNSLENHGDYEDRIPVTAFNPLESNSNGEKIDEEMKEIAEERVNDDFLQKTSKFLNNIKSSSDGVNKTSKPVNDRLLVPTCKYFRCKMIHYCRVYY